jgi:V/A-type H+-transporting ATPase subunit D
MRRVSATRTELLAHRARIEFADQGRDLLEDKRRALLRELTRVAETAAGISGDLAKLAAKGRLALAEAVALDGPEAVGSAALAASGDVELQLGSEHVAGVRLVAIDSRGASRDVAARGYSLTATTPRIDRVAELYERLLDVLLQTAATDLTLRRLAAEIRTTTRRINALERVVLPRLVRERDRIAIVLEEREREDRVRLRRAKAETVAP